MHGDFTPWNLRRLANGDLALLDWEGAGWGPPGADEVLYRAAATAVLGAPPVRVEAPEAIRFWRERLERRLSGQVGGATDGGPQGRGRRDRRLDLAVRQALREMEEAARPGPAVARRP